ncbi:quinoprotein dehydrogenase-associated SoxYZ-like carrier [Methylocystis sp. 9N]|uniref:Quinoprotein dehydrogenase-associated SoxYZ-like carrier n=1 Tax=Methylocystis borbori TaxID=3118750 RepID=A0ABU7XHS4_9HYPH
MLRKTAHCAIGAFGALAAFFVATGAFAEGPADPWPGLVADIFQNRAIGAADGAITLEAPARAEDAAIVPMTMRFSDPTQIKVATLVIDQNPMPMAAAFTLGETAGVGFIETRVRVNSYSNVHAVAETRSATLRADAKFVKASGGCSAPAVKDQDEALANVGKMKYREFKSADPAKREAQIMIRHPNASGMQMDPVTRAYLPAHFIDSVEVWRGDALVFKMEGGISLSEDPAFRFSYAPNGAKTMRVEAHDNKGGVYKGEWPIGEAS